MWSRKFEKCIECGTNEKRHWAKGYCRSCYCKTPKYKKWAREFAQTPSQIKRRKEYYSRPEVKENYAKLQGDYRKKHPEYVEWNKEYIQKNRKRYNLHQYIWRLNNFGKVKKSLKDYYLKNKEKIKMKKKEYIKTDTYKSLEIIRTIQRGCNPKNKEVALQQIKILQNELEILK